MWWIWATLLCVVGAVVGAVHWLSSGMTSEQFEEYCRECDGEESDADRVGEDR